MNNIKITGTKWYVDIEFKDNIARFDGELCVNSFCAIISSARWIKHKGNACADDLCELFREVKKHNQKNAFKVLFFDNDENRTV